MSMENSNLPGPLSGIVASAVEYMVHAGQRSVLFLDIMRQRGEQYREHVAQTAPHVLSYAAELIIDGRKLEQPVNYALVRIIPPKGVEIDLKRRPFIVVDPRAGHGPGIGGFKADSEIGVAMKAGHPCYFIGFLPEPMPGQLSKVSPLPRPCSLKRSSAASRGRRQALRDRQLPGGLGRDDFGVATTGTVWPDGRCRRAALLLGGRPRQISHAVFGGLLGGSWLTALSSDLGGGKFDGGRLVPNFENQNPSNTLWTKQYNVYSKVDTEADRYLEFERWWGGHVNLNAEEIQFIVDELFIGNNLAAGRIETSDGTAIDLRNIRSPIVVFCSKGTTSPRRSRPSTASSTFMTTSTRSGLTGRPLSTPCMKPSAISASSSPAASPRRSMPSSPAIST